VNYKESNIKNSKAVCVECGYRYASLVSECKRCGSNNVQGRTDQDTLRWIVFEKSLNKFEETFENQSIVNIFKVEQENKSFSSGLFSKKPSSPKFLINTGKWFDNDSDDRLYINHTFKTISIHIENSNSIDLIIKKDKKRVLKEINLNHDINLSDYFKDDFLIKGLGGTDTYFKMMSNKNNTYPFDYLFFIGEYGDSITITPNGEPNRDIIGNIIMDNKTPYFWLSIDEGDY
jgi:hypothetical protein